MIQRRGLLALCCVSAALIVLGTAVAIAGFGGGSTAAWLEGLSTLAAFLAAIVAATYAAGAFQLESERDARLRADRRSSQAAFIAVWGTVNVGLISARLRDTVSEVVAILDVRDASELPVTDVRLHVEADTAWAWDPVDPDGHGGEPVYVGLHRLQVPRLPANPCTSRSRYPGLLTTCRRNGRPWKLTSP